MVYQLECMYLPQAIYQQGFDIKTKGFLEIVTTRLMFTTPTIWEGHCQHMQTWRTHLVSMK